MKKLRTTEPHSRKIDYAGEKLLRRLPRDLIRDPKELMTCCHKQMEICLNMKYPFT